MKLDRIIAVRTSKTVYRDGDKAIKLFDEGYSKSDILNEYDEISYILCGLNLISYNRSLKYIKKEKVVDKLINKQLDMVLENKKLYDSTIELYKFIKVKFKL